MPYFSPLEQICHLPTLFYQGHDNVGQIIHGSGVALNDLALGPVMKIVRENPELITDWLRWSGDKRQAEGWYFQTDETLFIIGFHPQGDRQVFEDGYVACAQFIVKEVGAMLGKRSTESGHRHNNDGHPE